MVGGCCHHCLSYRFFLHPSACSCILECRGRWGWANGDFCVHIVNDLFWIETVWAQTRLIRKLNVLGTVAMYYWHRFIDFRWKITWLLLFIGLVTRNSFTFALFGTMLPLAFFLPYLNNVVVLRWLKRKQPTLFVKTNHSDWMLLVDPSALLGQDISNSKPKRTGSERKLLRDMVWVCRRFQNCQRPARAGHPSNLSTTERLDRGATSGRKSSERCEAPFRANKAKL